jgi:hypothetical protein
MLILIVPNPFSVRNIYSYILVYGFISRNNSSLLSLTPITTSLNGLYYQQSQPDAQLHQDGQGHKLESVEGLARLEGRTMRD